MSILQMGITGGLLVIAIFLIRAVALNYLPKKMFLMLWGVVLFRLLAPVSMPLPFSVPSIICDISRTVLPDSSIPLVINNILNASEAEVGRTGTPKKIGEGAQGEFYNIALATTIWLLGMIAAFIICAVIYYINYRGLRFAMTIRENDYLNEWLAEHRLLRSITIMQSDRILSPLAVGIIKPRIIIPKTMNMSDKQLLNYVLAHEYFHIKRYDAIWKMLLLLAICIHWYNPMAWVMFALASRDLELTCDEAVINRFGVKIKKAYAYMLIGMAVQGGEFAPLYNGFSKNAIEERIESIMKIKKTSLVGIIIAILLVVGATTVLAKSSNSTDISKNAISSEQYQSRFDIDPDKTEVLKINISAMANGERSTIGEVTLNEGDILTFNIHCEGDKGKGQLYSGFMKPDDPKKELYLGYVSCNDEIDSYQTRVTTEFAGNYYLVVGNDDVDFYGYAGTLTNVSGSISITRP